MDAASQKAAILAALKRGESLTPLEALQRFHCFRLPARIWDLKQEGYSIEREMVPVGDTRVARYRMAA